MIDRFEIIVGNVGTVYTGNNRVEAENEYRECCAMVDQPYGRASGEDVTFMMDGDIHEEYQSKAPQMEHPDD